MLRWSILSVCFVNFVLFLETFTYDLINRVSVVSEVFFLQAVQNNHTFAWCWYNKVGGGGVYCSQVGGKKQTVLNENISGRFCRRSDLLFVSKLIAIWIVPYKYYKSLYFLFYKHKGLTLPLISMFTMISFWLQVERTAVC